MARFTKFLPEPGKTGVQRTAAISFTVLDDAYGAQISTLSASVGGVRAISGGSFVGGFSGQIIAGSGKWVTAIYPRAPSFLARASEIEVEASVRNSLGELDSYGWSFFTVGYVAPGSPSEDSPAVPPNRACLVGKPFFVHNMSGLDAALDAGVGTEVDLQWLQASPYDENNAVVYNIYMSTSLVSVFDNPPQFMSTALSASIGGLHPGDTHFFAVRASEMDPQVSSLRGLKQAGSSMFRYPSTFLSSAVGDGYLEIPVESVEGFPEFGIAVVEDELIKYSSLRQVPPALMLADAYGRGCAGSLAESHLAGVAIGLYWGREDDNTVISQATPTFQKPEAALTYVLPDGYGQDGYRDGYDGYSPRDGYDGYLMHRQVNRDDITTPVENSNDGSGNFPSFDHCGSYRRESPAALWKGQCVPSYLGGIQYRDGVFVREQNMRSQMLQREELMLETTGEPFVLLRRKWTGMRCPCHMQRREHADKRCPNCYGTGFQNGYDQFVNPRRPDGRILARVSPATEDLVIEDKGGLTPQYSPSAWTMAFPGIKDRDALVRFNEDGTEEFRYMILNVERVKEFFAQSGAQKFNMQRFHRTDIIYQYPVQRDMSPFPSAAETDPASAPGIPSHTHVLYFPNGIDVGNLNGVTAVNHNHSHVIRNGMLLPAFGHVHTLTI